MKKRTFIMLSSLSMLLCMGGAQVANAIHPTASINMLAEDDGDLTFSTTDGQNSVTLKKSADGKTLTISGKGDLTKLDATYKFSQSALNTIFKANGSSYASVNANDECETSTSYYTRSEKYEEIEDFSNSHVTEKTHYYFTAMGAQKYYTRRQTSWDENPTYDYTAVTENTEVSSHVEGEQDESGNWVNKSIYFTKNDDGTYTRVSNVSTITSSTSDVTSKQIEHLSNCDNVFVKNGNTYSQVYNDQVYNENQTYYQRSYEYTATTLDYLTANAYVYNANSFIQALWAVGKAATVETIKFENTDSSNPLYIDNDIVKATLYYQDKNEYATWYTINGTTKTLDLGAATCKNFSQATFTNTFGANGTSILSNITLPLANADENNAIVVPQQVLTTFKGSATTITIPEGYTKIGDYAFGAETNNGYGYEAMDKATTFNLPSTIKEIGNYAFAGCSQLKGITLNEGLTYIGKYAFWGSSLESIAFPSSLDKIDDAAFADLKIELIFNEGLRYIGAGAFALSSNMVCETIEIPTTVRYIGPGAFNFRQYQDVYFLGTDAPLMPMGSYTVGSYTTDNTVAFSEYTLMGNNGFQSSSSGEGDLAENVQTGYANRENYKGNSAYFCILHYPQGLTDAQANKYKDQTRIYLTQTTDFNMSNAYKAGEEADGTQWTIYGSMSQPQKEVNYGYQDTYLGDQYVWPSQTQWGRAYVVASNGYNWNGTTAYYAPLSNDDYKVLKEAGFIEGEIADLTDAQKQNLQKIAHLGTRMFVLANADSKTTPDYPVNIKSANKWWTIVVPFNMTKSEVDKVFGDGKSSTHVCRFNKADRHDNGYGDKLVKLYFTDDVYAHKAVKDESGNYGKSETTAPGEDDVVIYAHEAYMIYPTKYIDYDKGERYTVKNYTLVTGSPTPTLVKANTHDASYEGEDNTEYRFIGNYIGEVSSSKIETEGEAQAASAEKTYVPQYSYMYAKKKSETNYKFWFWYGATANGVVFTPNTCVVQATDKNGGSKDYSEIFEGNKAGASVSAKQISIFGDEDDEATGIDDIEIITPDTQANGIVYNLNGQPVSNGSTTGLAKGIYIKDGKKFVVK